MGPHNAGNPGDQHQNDDNQYPFHRLHLYLGRGMQFLESLTTAGWFLFPFFA
jgi:hypothetical protein